MATIWIGDFRSSDIQTYLSQNITTTSEESDTANNSESVVNDLSEAYLFEDTADSSWFAQNLLEQLPRLSLETANVVFMLGFNDCVYSCLWDVFDINDIIKSYSNTISKLANDYTNLKFYVCSVCPVDGDYAHTAAPNGIISCEALNEQINVFNNGLKEAIAAFKDKSLDQTNKGINITVSFIDINDYLNTTSFYTHDGIRFDEGTIIRIADYIGLNIKQVGGSFFKERTEAPKPPTGDASIDGPGYWVQTSKAGGLNPYILGELYNKFDGDVLPNCTGYAWGRFYEITGIRPNFCSTDGTHNAEMWYLYDGTHASVGYKDDGYKRGKEPALGAVICWSKGVAAFPANDGPGHVAIVEAIDSDGNITISESGWHWDAYWYRRPITREIRNGEPYYSYGSDYNFQGFIYNPKYFAGNVIKDIPKEDVITRNDYLSQQEMETNAIYIWNYFGSNGWTLNAVAGMLGNMQTESSLSPNRCEISDTVSGPSSDHPTAEDIRKYAYNYRAAHGRFPGYGIVQWTGQREGGNKTDWADQKYIHWCNNQNPKLDPSDIDSQLKRILWECKNGEQFYSSSAYPMTFEDFSKSTQSARYLAEAFLDNYENPQSPDFKTRGDQGMKWYNFLLQYAPTGNMPISLKGLKVDSIKPTEVKCSFLASSIKSYKYTIYTVTSIETVTKLDEIETSVTNADSTIGNVFAFTYDQLVPNNSYRLVLEVTGNQKTDVLTQTIDFDTPQALPESVSMVELVGKETENAKDLFQLNILPSKPNFGYWRNIVHMDCGYNLQLIVNGTKRDEIEVGIDDLPDTITMASLFKNYQIKTVDTVQLGIRTWVKYNGEKIYDSRVAKTSDIICGLKKPIIAYLNAD